MAEQTRDTIYIDIDDEITAIIDKVRSSNAKIIALVLPKRASVFQSVVNMKLLKRATEQDKKHIVLITSEAGLLPLAGAVGIYVAKTLATKPEIPTAPTIDDGREEMVEETASLEDESDADAQPDKTKPVGELAGAVAAASALPPLSDGVETVELDDDKELPAASKQKPTAKEPKLPKKDKSLKVPNFQRFRLVLVAIILLVIVVICFGLYLGLKVLPKASVDVQTDASTVHASVNLTLDTTATSLDPSTNTVPAKQVTEQKTYAATVAATGQQNNGQEASGTIQISAGACGFDVPADLPAGSTVTANGNNYITQGDTSFVPTTSNRHCTYEGSTATGITAAAPGTAYNTSSSNTTFSVPSESGDTATGSASGGTDNIQTVVQQSDISSAESKINTQNDGVKTDLEQQLRGDNMYAIPATFSTGNPSISISTPAGNQASNVTVTETITYAMYGAPQSDLATLLTNDINSQDNSSAQGILNNGLSSATFTTNNAANTSVTMATIASVGPNIDVTTIKQQAAGQKSAAIVAAVKSDPDVTNVSVHFSPFWVSSAPKNTSKITVTVAKPTASTSDGSAN